MRALALAAVVLFGAFSAALPVAAQPAADPALLAERREAIARLDFMIGTFTGEGWIVGPDRVRQTFTHVERAETRMDGLVLTVEGTGTSPGADEPSFRAFGVISWNTESDVYEMQTFAYGAHWQVSGALIAPGVFQWGFEPNERVAIRYTITAPEPGQWREIGEVSLDQGQTWNPFFEMNLTRAP